MSDELMDKWHHKDEWKRAGNDFLISVTRHQTDTSPTRGDGPHRWAVYAYIYSTHRLFGTFDGPKVWQDAAIRLPLHGRASFLSWHYDDDHKATSVQVGADYNHLHDDDYTHYADADSAYSVFVDADELFDWLQGDGAA